MNINYKKTFNLYFFSFFMYCIIGWIYEVVLEIFVFNHGFVNRGFLYGPYLPVYGFGAVILLLMLKNIAYKKINIRKINITPFITFLAIFFITTIIEYFTGYMLDTVLNMRLWDYSNNFLNINGLVCFSASLRFAIGGTVFIYFLQPFFIKLINKIPMKTQSILVITIFTVMVIDLILTLTTIL